MKKVVLYLRDWGRVICMVLTVCGMCSCSDFLDEESHHALPDSQNWKTLEDARAGLMGVYGMMRAALADNNTQWVCGDLRLGDFSAENRSDLNAVIHNDLNRNEALVEQVADWNRFYAVVNAASVYMEHVGAIVGQDMAYSEQTMKWDVAQARALRALAYFYMARIWGNVPLITSSYDNGSFPQVPRSSASTVLLYAKNELLTAAEALPFQFGSDNNQYYRQSPTFWQGKLLNKLSVYAILAHLSAWTGHYTDAETYAAYVLNNYTHLGIKEGSQYMSVDNIVSETGLFCGSTTTYAPYRLVAFNFIYKDNLDMTQSGHLEQWTLSEPYVPKLYPDLYVTKDSLTVIYDDFKDQRMGMDTITHKYQTTYFDMSMTKPIFKKINVIQDGAGKDGDFAVFGSSNRGLSVLSFKKDFKSDVNKLIDNIFGERRRELIGEGHRWYDQIRRQKLRKDNPILIDLINNGGIYWPVSEEVLEQNSLIHQNPYWE
ncbi:MAG: RagB/SusD family nutrient uptake outer membrane protein [Paraprevotella sp.]|nr:RagB/SusD family nutrient uptake outer membrane protein [Paraprevotella sp.]